MESAAIPGDVEARSQSGLCTERAGVLETKGRQKHVVLMIDRS